MNKNEFLRKINFQYYKMSNKNENKNECKFYSILNIEK